jgi:hypothetical protein
LYERVRVAAFFFKTWSYPVGRVEQQGDRLTKSQLAPLLIGKRVQVSSDKAATSVLELVPSVLVAALSLGILYAAFRVSRRVRAGRIIGSPASDDASVRSSLAKLEASPPSSN